jgi:hypothetical protein
MLLFQIDHLEHTASLASSLGALEADALALSVAAPRSPISKSGICSANEIFGVGNCDYDAVEMHEDALIIIPPDKKNNPCGDAVVTYALYRLGAGRRWRSLQ